MTKPKTKTAAAKPAAKPVAKKAAAPKKAAKPKTSPMPAALTEAFEDFPAAAPAAPVAPAAPEAPAAPAAPAERAPVALLEPPTGRTITVKIPSQAAAALSLTNPMMYDGAVKLTHIGRAERGSYRITAPESVMRQVQADAEDRGNGRGGWGHPATWSRACRQAAFRISEALKVQRHVQTF